MIGGLSKRLGLERHGDSAIGERRPVAVAVAEAAGGGVANISIVRAASSSLYKGDLVWGPNSGEEGSSKT